MRQVHPERVQVLGATEISLPARRCPRRPRARPIEAFFALNPACVVVTKGLEVPSDPAARSPTGWACRCCGRRWSRRWPSTQIQKFLELQLAPTASIHAVLMDVLGVGVLLLGKSGIGKSEAALELIMRGHRLVADDLVEVRRTSGSMLVGWASELIKHHMEVRGLGIINIKDMFGVAAVRDEKQIELVLELIRWDQTDAARSAGPRRDGRIQSWRCQVPLLRIPVSPGRNVSSLIEVAARNRLLQVRGHHSAREFQERLDQALADARERRWRDDVE